MIDEATYYRYMAEFERKLFEEIRDSLRTKDGPKANWS